MFAQHVSKDLNLDERMKNRPILEIKKEIKIIKNDISEIKKLLVELKDIIKPDKIDSLLRLGMDELEEIEPVSKGWFW
tara:strand:- start:172 stop:405 length:234 start_codon:yes stop_codon:yes gene_type:complete